jgi:hypothetical protein
VEAGRERLIEGLHSGVAIDRRVRCSQAQHEITPRLAEREVAAPCIGGKRHDARRAARCQVSDPKTREQTELIRCAKAFVNMVRYGLVEQPDAALEMESIC